MSEQNAEYSQVVEIAKRNGDYRKNWGTIVGAFLFLRSLQAVRPRSIWWQGLIAVAVGVAGWWIKS